MHKIKNNKGFSLIELLVVVSVIAILGTVAVTAYIGSTLKADRSRAYANLSALKMFQEQFYSEGSVYSTTIANFPGFTPAPGEPYTYAVMGTGIALPAGVQPVPYGGATVAQTNCFVITATGIAGTRTAGDIFVIDCNDNRNF